ncbi:unnamed protein product [Rotaria magnacalcarata]|uniref:Uncharacterized protein n=1 Tax=Rotaria magnacalcarata TaxID=392030 RepID=A0A819VCH8_9BILA|nr:unnamed protein product [Rotaria magnacalcarata]CAF4107227.1 unnamed protein product [Rotaria magnacalcarata]
MPTVFYEQLNKALREENREALKPWFYFIRLIMSDLEKLPDDGDSRPDHVFHNKKIPPYSDVKKRLEINAKSSSAISSMRFKQDGGKDVAFGFQIDPWAAKAPKEKSEKFNLQNGWRAKITVGMDGGETL